MTVIDDTECNCKYFTGGDDERNKMQFELLNHSVDKHLPNERKNSHDAHVKQEPSVGDDECAHTEELPKHEGVDY